MARAWYIDGECLALVKGRTDSNIANLSELGLSEDQIKVTPHYKHEPITVEAWGKLPPELQWMGGSVSVSMNLINFDAAILNECQRLSMGGAGSPGNVGNMARAGQVMGNMLPRFAPSPNQSAASTGYNGGNNFIGLNLTAPQNGIPWRFLFAYLADPPVSYPLGAEKTVVACNWEVIPYTIDPYNGGLGAYNYQLYDHTLDN